MGDTSLGAPQTYGGAGQNLPQTEWQGGACNGDGQRSAAEAKANLANGGCGMGVTSL